MCSRTLATHGLFLSGGGGGSGCYRRRRRRRGVIPSSSTLSCCTKARASGYMPTQVIFTRKAELASTLIAEFVCVTGFAGSHLGRPLAIS